MQLIVFGEDFILDSYFNMEEIHSLCSYLLEYPKFFGQKSSEIYPEIPIHLDISSTLHSSSLRVEFHKLKPEKETYEFLLCWAVSASLCG